MKQRAGIALAALVAAGCTTAPVAPVEEVEEAVAVDTGPATWIAWAWLADDGSAALEVRLRAEGGALVPPGADEDTGEWRAGSGLHLPVALDVDGIEVPAGVVPIEGVAMVDGDEVVFAGGASNPFVSVHVELRCTWSPSPASGNQARLVVEATTPTRSATRELDPLLYAVIEDDGTHHDFVYLSMEAGNPVRGVHFDVGDAVPTGWLE